MIDQNEINAIRAAGYTDTQLAEISLAVALTIFTNIFNRINGTGVFTVLFDRRALPSHGAG